MNSKLSWFILSVFCFVCSACNKLETSHIVIQPAIVKNAVYKKLDLQKDTREFGPPDAILTAKTSNVSYVNDRGGKIIDTSFARIYNCKGYLKNDSLHIVIGIGNGFTAWGFSINCYNNSFNVEPYYETDMVIIGKPKPTFRAIYQNLILNKPHYALGDSIFGKINFKVIETGTDGKITHIGDGYFRSKIDKELN